MARPGPAAAALQWQGARERTSTDAATAATTGGLPDLVERRVELPPPAVVGGHGLATARARPRCPGGRRRLWDH